jgi:hypothetical protein
MSDSHFDDVELLAAEAVDVAIDDALGGRPGGDPVVSGLVAAFAVALPPGLAADIRARAAVEQDRRSRNWLPARLAAAVLAYLYAVSGIVNIFFGHWLARVVKNAYAPHVYREGGLAFLAVSALLAWAVFRPRWLDAAVLVGSPLGVLIAINGAGEIINLRPGAVDHVPELAGALALAFFWWRAKRRYETDGSGEEKA